MKINYIKKYINIDYKICYDIIIYNMLDLCLNRRGFCGYIRNS